MKEKFFELVRDACALEEDGLSEQTCPSQISLDSLSFIRLIVGIEDEFGVDFDDELLNIADWQTLGDLMRITESKINETRNSQKSY